MALPPTKKESKMSAQAKLREEAPRWRLTQPHYLNVPGTEWERMEVDTKTGRAIRQRFNVPMLLDPNDPVAHNANGMVVVSHSDEVPGDWVFEGDPTPDMEPLNAAAQAITDEMMPKWVHPVNGLPITLDGQSFAEQLVRAFQSQMDAVKTSPAAPNQSLAGVDPAEFKAMQEQLAALMKQNAELQAQAAEKPEATPVVRRV